MLAVPGKARCSVHEAELQRAKWQRSPNRDMDYRRLKRLVVWPVECGMCHQQITHFGHDGASHTFDHTPWSEAPSNDPSNLRHAHKRCNSSRGRGPRVA
jgi:hypothetical protein